MDQRLSKEKLEAKMLLTVHDELIFEVPENELQKLEQIVCEVMEQAVELDVPLKVDVNWGDSWFEAK